MNKTTYEFFDKFDFGLGTVVSSVVYPLLIIPRVMLGVYLWQVY